MNEIDNGIELDNIKIEYSSNFDEIVAENELDDMNFSEEIK